MRSWHGLPFAAQIVFGFLRFAGRATCYDEIVAEFGWRRGRSMCRRGVLALMRRHMVSFNGTGFVLNNVWEWSDDDCLVCAPDFSTKKPSPGYRPSWSENVVSRDGLCLSCGSRHNLCAHHIQPRHARPELRDDITNGITLCSACHRAIKGRESDVAPHLSGLLGVTV